MILPRQADWRDTDTATARRRSQAARPDPWPGARRRAAGYPGCHPQHPWQFAAAGHACRTALPAQAGTP